MDLSLFKLSLELIKTCYQTTPVQTGYAVLVNGIYQACPATSGISRERDSLELPRD